MSGGVSNVTFEDITMVRDLGMRHRGVLPPFYAGARRVVLWGFVLVGGLTHQHGLGQ